MSRPPYRALQVLLYVLTLLLIVGGVLMIFANKPLIMRVFLRPPEAEFSTLLLFVLREMGGFVLMFSLMLFFAARDPERNVAIIDAVIVGMGDVAPRNWTTYNVSSPEPELSRRQCLPR